MRFAGISGSTRERPSLTAIARKELSIALYRVSEGYGIMYYLFAGQKGEFGKSMPPYGEWKHVNERAELVQLSQVHDVWVGDLTRYASRKTGEVGATGLGHVFLTREDEGGREVRFLNYQPRSELGKKVAPKLALQEELMVAEDLKRSGVERIFGSNIGDKPAEERRISQLESIGISHGEFAKNGIGIDRYIEKLKMGISEWISARRVLER